MKFSQVLFVAVSMAPAVLGGCYKSGDSGHYGAGLGENGVLESQCGQLAGTYEKDEDSHGCGTDSFNTKWQFYVKNKNGKKATLDYNNCLSYMKKESGACEHGGENTHDGWFVVADPNAGTCIPSNNNKARRAVAQEWSG
ncbi:hypothetical protein JX265_003514 [Neoarthrinium moseri]|uniref:Secreted protein n=1 Tax=Neoarthrinium moseri TaxID=1658444 RepID=A0A9Q0AT38_9PEZI|nr:hypothetical protein JX266_004522 [Neoarthrinium moseri]KAI1877506.1 hypothetical protein JX265_003514 [Neoarthrinium moseri]